LETCACFQERKSLLGSSNTVGAEEVVYSKQARGIDPQLYRTASSVLDSGEVVARFPFTRTDQHRVLLHTSLKKPL
jgi:hypothetical protein